MRKYAHVIAMEIDDIVVTLHCTALLCNLNEKKEVISSANDLFFTSALAKSIQLRFV